MSNAALILKNNAEVEIPLESMVTAPQVLDPLKAKVDRLATVLTHYKAKEKAFKAETKSMKKELDELTAEIKEYAREKNLITLLGEKADLEFTGREENSVDPLTLFKFFQAQGNPAEFFKYVKVGMTDLKADLGDSAVRTAGLVINGFNKWFSIKALPKV